MMTGEEFLTPEADIIVEEVTNDASLGKSDHQGTAITVVNQAISLTHVRNASTMSGMSTFRDLAVDMEDSVTI